MDKYTNKQECEGSYKPLGNYSDPRIGVTDAVTHFKYLIH